ncbi:MAG: AAA family ATPase [Planctomycetota bacterium]
MSSETTLEREIADLRLGVDAVRAAVAKRFLGYEEEVEQVLLGLIARGHVLLEGAPGLGKTTLARSLAGSLDLVFGRIQCTPDLMPADVLGTRILEEDPRGARRFTFQKGPVFCNVLLVDEINRATPRTQSGLLEAMQEHQVTVFGETKPLDEPFFVIATQNPIEMEGTYPLPEAQLDRFLLKIQLTAPGPRELEVILRETTRPEPSSNGAVLTRDRLMRLQTLVREVPASSDVTALVARLVVATHPEQPAAPDSVRRFVRWGASPRGGQALLLAAKARALVRGRLFVAEEDLGALAVPALRHRLVLSFEAEAQGARADEVVASAWESARRG